MNPHGKSPAFPSVTRTMAVLFLALGATLCLAAPAAFGQTPAAPATPPPPLEFGVDYKSTLGPRTLLKDTGKPLELVYVFWYGCGSCRELDPSVDQYAKLLPPDVVFAKIHAMYAPNLLWTNQARLFHTLQYLGKEEELHKEIFKEVQENGGTDGEGRALAGLADLDSMLLFAEKHGISKEDFTKAWESPEVEKRFQLALTFIDNLDIDSVPAMAVNGKWAFTVMRGKGRGHFFRTADELLARERELLSGSGAETSNATGAATGNAPK
ncbi:MAG: thiol:disulfide interchange protein DsbA/DsbL [Deltaproteobacteria bacterium]|nr:thiol:disulfide interchange protein DsbA/DsbL [Deltaproteobacteria bacterium]